MIHEVLRCSLRAEQAAGRTASSMSGGGGCRQSRTVTMVRSITFRYLLFLGCTSRPEAFGTPCFFVPTLLSQPLCPSLLSQQAEAAAILASISDYNEYDCLSTLRLRDWLLQLGHDASASKDVAVAAAGDGRTGAVGRCT